MAISRVLRNPQGHPWVWQQGPRGLAHALSLEYTVCQHDCLWAEHHELLLLLLKDWHKTHRDVREIPTHNRASCLVGQPLSDYGRSPGVLGIMASLTRAGLHLAQAAMRWDPVLLSTTCPQPTSQRMLSYMPCCLQLLSAA